jgi:protein-tyrosine phosphatase
MSYAEIHFHLLPGIDDGPRSVDESVELAGAAATEGTRTIVATPHVHPRFVADPLTLTDRVEEIRAELRARRIPIEVRCGGELDVAMPSRLTNAQMDTIAHGPRGRRWVLLEAPLRGMDDSYTAVADDVRDRGFAVVMAHPERAFKDPEAGWRVVEHELAAGSALQVNAWSVAGLYGERVRATAVKLVQRASKAVIASDAHGGERMPALNLALRALTSAGVANPVALVSTAPYALLEHGLAVAPDALAA